jgi:Cys-tRNA(Pro)/Cys-tRNA(Cys) deacylase
VKPVTQTRPRGGKTQAMRLMDQRGVAYTEIHFPETIHDAPGVAAHAGIPVGEVFKTLVIVPEGSARPALILLPGDRVLDLKQAARAMGVKRAEMASHAEAEKLTGLKVGGISALALTHRRWPVFLDRHADGLESFVVSAGQRGVNVRIRVSDFVTLTDAAWIDATRSESTGG